MRDHALEQVKRKFVKLMRTEPPALSGTLPREPLAPVIDRWVASRFSSLKFPSAPSEIPR